MRFAHLADVHLGGWREPRLRDANQKAFELVIRRILQERVDFVLIAGDLFNTSMPPIEALRVAVEQLKLLKDAGIPVYAIAGSHDFSPSGKTMLDVLAKAGLLVDVHKGTVIDGRLKLDFTINPKTGVKLAGMIGKKGGLDKVLYEDLVRDHLESEPGAKIFLFHCALSELKPKGLEDMDAAPISCLPKGFAYYAGGHVHVVDSQSIGGYANIVYPGPVFPNNFAELEKLRKGSFVLFADGKPAHIFVEPHRVVSVSVGCNRSSPEAESAIRAALESEDVKDAIVLIRAHGTLQEGRVSDIRFDEISQWLASRGAYAVLRNTNALSSKDFVDVKVAEGTVEDVERQLITQQPARQDVIPGLMRVLAVERDEGEKVADFEKRIKADVDALLGWSGKF